MLLGTSIFIGLLNSGVAGCVTGGGGSWGSGWAVGMGNIWGGGGGGIGLGRRGLAGGSGCVAVFCGGGGIAWVRIFFSRFFW